MDGFIGEHHHMKYMFLTGSTGLVGRYLLRDLLLADERVAVLARSTKIDSAATRVEAILTQWEAELGFQLPRPVVFDGSLNDEDFGLSSEDRSWIESNCDRVLHCAAAMAFRPDKHGEPWRTNVEGTQRLVDFCRGTGIRHFHHVSTCYICGLRSGRILESDIDQGQTLGNVYEDSKLKAEKLLRAADCFDSLTFYRPSSVVGDSRTGFTTSHHGFYLPLQLAYTVSTQIPPREMGTRFFAKLGLKGDEGKNIVPVDWLAAAIVQLVRRPECHNATYQLANPQPATVKSIQQVIQDAILRYSPKQTATTITEQELQAYESVFQEYMEVYRSHWRDDPKFDVTNAQQTLVDLPCPEMDYDTLMTIARYPIENNFNSRRVAVEETDKVTSKLRALSSGHGSFPNGSTALSSNNQPRGNSSAHSDISLQINGPGGGQWRLTAAGGQITQVERGLGPESLTRVYLSAETLASLKRVPASQLIDQGRIVVTSANGSMADIVSMLQQLAT